ncbi:MAG: hypothetical protein ABI679_12505, partial [Gemmatimonadota bacterium]
GFAAAVWNQPSGPPTGWMDGLSVVAGMVSLIALICLPLVQADYRRELRLRRGTGARARWSVSPSEWRRFQENEKVAEQKGEVLLNMIDTRQRAGNAGVEIIVGNGALIVGGEYRVIGTQRPGETAPVWIPSDPPTLEYRFTNVDPDNSYVERALRLPVAAGQEEVARRLCRP